jgi:type IV pilus assembly protein PilC
MPKYSYVAMDSRGKETKGTLEAASQNEAITRVKEMNFFPTKIVEVDKEKADKKSKTPAKPKPGAKGAKKKGGVNLNIKIPGLSGRVKSKVLTTFTRQLATLVDAGLPLLRGLRVLEKQEKNATLKGIIGELSLSIEGGSTFSEGLAQHPKVFNRLFVNMVKAGELGGVLEVVLNRLMVFVIPKFRDVFSNLLEGAQLPTFTRIVLGISETIKNNILYTLAAIAVIVGLFMWVIRTRIGRRLWDKFQLKSPVIGPVVSKVAIARFTRTLGTLVTSGVPILQALNIVKETAGNVIIASAVSAVHDSVKEGETITAPLEASGVFPPMVISMVDVGEQTGALPEMLLKIADNYDDEVDNAVSAMTSLLEPIMIVFLAVVVGSIVIAMFLPLIALMSGIGGDKGGGGD